MELFANYNTVVYRVRWKEYTTYAHSEGIYDIHNLSSSAAEKFMSCGAYDMCSSGSDGTLSIWGIPGVIFEDIYELQSESNQVQFTFIYDFIKYIKDGTLPWQHCNI